MAEERYGRLRSRFWFGFAWTLAGVVLGIVAVLVAVPLLRATKDAAAELPRPEQRVSGSKAGPKAELSGSAGANLHDFVLKDREGHTVLKLGRFLTLFDVSGIPSNVMRMPGGTISDVELTLRRGPSGRVSIAEAFNPDKDPNEKPTRKPGAATLDLGPFKLRNVRLNVAMMKRPVVVQMDEATVRVQRTPRDVAPKIFLSDFRGTLLKPDPLSQPILIRGGEGVVDLERDPLVDLRARVCMGAGEMRVRFELQDRKQIMNMSVDAHGALGNLAAVALHIVSMIKDEKLNVDKQRVQIAEAYDCSRAEGKDERPEVDAQKERSPAEHVGVDGDPPRRGS